MLQSIFFEPCLIFLYFRGLHYSWWASRMLLVRDNPYSGFAIGIAALEGRDIAFYHCVHCRLIVGDVLIDIGARDSS